MEACQVLIVGGGPAGSTCAWSLRQAGLDVRVIDKSPFPRDKTCAGWITPQVIASLKLDVDEYSRHHVFQPITGFQLGVLAERTVTVQFDHPVSYGIRRCEFDDYLLRRAGVPCQLGEPVKSIERTSSGWVINGSLSASMLVGAGGHFCPVARNLQARGENPAPLVTAVEVEFPICLLNGPVGTDGHVPQLYFWPDLNGYGWCVQKGEYLNIGLGLVDSRKTSSEVPTLLDELARQQSVAAAIPTRFHGHAYALYDGCRAPILDDAVLLIGDAAGLAYPQSGEGIRPAIESGLLAAQTIVAARGDYRAGSLEPYERQIRQRFGHRSATKKGTWLALLPQSLKRALLARLISNPWFARKLVIERWFLHAHQPALLT